MQNAPIVSVIVPVYNAERTILETIVSVQQQTFPDFELIVINNGSTDRTLELLQTVEDNHLKIFSYEQNGPSVGRNHGIAQATGEFIAFLDADDLWTPDKLELQLRALQQHPEAGVAYSWTNYIDEQGKYLGAGVPIFFEGNVQAKLLVNNFIASGSNPLIRRQAIESVGEFDSTYKGFEDWEYWLRISARWPFVVVPKYQIFYRQSSNSLSSKVQLMEEAGLLVVENVFRAVPPELQILKNKSLAWVYQYCTQKYLQQRDTITDDVDRASQKLWMAIRLYPQTLLTTYTQTLLKWLLKKRIKKWIIARLKLQNS